jgi:hypothetical protein
VEENRTTRGGKCFPAVFGRQWIRSLFGFLEQPTDGAVRETVCETGLKSDAPEVSREHFCFRAYGWVCFVGFRWVVVISGSIFRFGARRIVLPCGVFVRLGRGVNARLALTFEEVVLRCRHRHRVCASSFAAGLRPVDRCSYTGCGVYCRVLDLFV